MDFVDQRIAITGATGGIGSALAAALAANGAECVLISRNLDSLNLVQQSLPGGPHTIVPIDVTDENSWDNALSQILSLHGTLDGLITAAGTLLPIGPIGSWSIGDFRHCIDVNLIGSLLAITSTLAGLVRCTGSILTFSGGGGTTPFPRFDAYAASKAALVRLTENLAPELDAQGVRINCVAPGFIASSIHEQTINAGPERVGREYFDRTQQIMATQKGDSIEKMTALCLFLLSPAASGITGKLVSAQWDPWIDESFRQKLRTDNSFATVRRIDDQFFEARETDDTA